MPSERSARVAYRHYVRNRPIRSSLRTYRTQAERSIVTGTDDEAKQAVVKAQQALDKAASKKIIHRNKAARLKSRLSRKLNAAAATTVTASPT
jgi:small subunit ribosomal protein S20